MQLIVQTSGLKPEQVNKVLKALDSVSKPRAVVTIANVIAMTKEEEKAQFEMLNSDSTNNISLVFSVAGEVGEQ